MLQRPHEGEVENQVDRNTERSDLHRGYRVFTGEKSGSQHFDQDIGGQTGGISGKGGRGRRRFGCAERAAFEQDAHDKIGHHHQGRGPRHRQQQREFQRPVHAAGGGFVVARAELARQQGQQRCADRDSDHPQRQLVYPVGVIQERDRTPRQQRRYDYVDQQVDLDHTGADHARQHQDQQPFDPRGQARAQQAQAEFGAVTGYHQPDELGGTGRSDTPG